MTNKLIENWLLKRATAESTKKQYPRLLQRFCDFHGLTPEKLIQEADDERQKPPSERVDIAFQRLEGFFQDLVKNQTHDSARNRTMVIKGFYSCSGVHVDWKKPKLKSANQRDRNHKLTLVKADRLLEKAGSDQLKAINAVLRDSALPPSDLCELNVGDLYPIEEDWRVIHKTRVKNKERLGLQILTFLGPVAVKYLNEWLEYRKQHIGAFEDSDPLFLVEQPKRSNAQDRRLVVRILDRHFWHLVQKAGLISEKDLKGRQNPYGPHKYRHLFTTLLMQTNMSDVVRQTCLGHKITGIDSSYYDTCEAEHFKTYKEHYWVLWPNRKDSVGKKARVTLKLELAWDQLKAAAEESGRSEDQLKAGFEEFKRKQFGDELEDGISGEATIELDEETEYRTVLRYYYRLLKG